MFNGKQFQEIKELLEKTNLRIDELTSQVRESGQEMDELKHHFTDEVNNLKDQSLEKTFQLSKELKNLQEQTQKFQRCVGTFENLKSNLDDVLTSKITSMAEFEIRKVKESLSNLNSVENDFKALVIEVNDLKNEINKFNTISKGIKEVDFTLNKHVQEIEQVDRKKFELEQENERLKTMMARMKRNRNI